IPGGHFPAIVLQRIKIHLRHGFAIGFVSGLKFGGCAKADRCVVVYRQIHPFPRLCDRSDRTGRVPGARRKQKRAGSCEENYDLLSSAKILKPSSWERRRPWLPALPTRAFIRTGRRGRLRSQDNDALYSETAAVWANLLCVISIGPH